MEKKSVISLSLGTSLFSSASRVLVLFFSFLFFSFSFFCVPLLFFPLVFGSKITAPPSTNSTTPPRCTAFTYTPPPKREIKINMSSTKLEYLKQHYALKKNSLADEDKKESKKKKRAKNRPDCHVDFMVAIGVRGRSPRGEFGGCFLRS